MTISNVSSGGMGRPYLAEGVKDLPAPLMSVIQNDARFQEPCDSIFVIPPQAFYRGLFGFNSVPWQALFFKADGVFHIRASRDHKDRQVCIDWIPADRIVQTRLALILLYSKLEFWYDRQGKIAHNVIEFNSVAYNKLEPLLKKTIRNTWQSPPEKPETVWSEYVDLEQLNIKFYNGLKLYGLQADEKVLGFVFQPEIMESHLKFIKRKKAPNSLVVITDRQIIQIEEEISSRSRYGWIFTFCPRHRIAGIETAAVDQWYRVSIHSISAASEDNLEFVLEPDKMARFQEMWQMFVNEDFKGK